MRVWWLVVLIGCRGGSDKAAPKQVDVPKVAVEPSPRPPEVRHVPTHVERNPTWPHDPWPTGSFALATELPGSVGTGDAYGTRHHVVRAEADPKARWVLACQQRHDTDGDGKIDRQAEAHFTLGDEPDAYLSFGGGPGAEIENVLAIAANGDRLLVEIDGAAVLIDATARTAITLPSVPSYASFSPDGTSLDYVDGNKVVHRTLADGKSVTWPITGDVEGVYSAGRWVALARAPSSDVSPFADWCTFTGASERSKGPPRWIDVTTGKILDDTTIVRPFGDHVVKRVDQTLELDGKPLGPSDCATLTVAGVHEPTGGVVLHCFAQAKSQYVAPGREPVEIRGSLNLSRSAIPPAVEGRWCNLGRCVELATGVLGERVEREPPALDTLDWWTKGSDGKRLLVSDQRERGPLRWRDVNPPLTLTSCGPVATAAKPRTLWTPVTITETEKLVAQVMQKELAELERCAATAGTGSMQAIVRVARGKIVKVVAGGHGNAAFEACVARHFDESKAKVAMRDGEVACNFVVGSPGPWRASVRDFSIVIAVDRTAAPTKPSWAKDEDPALIITSPDLPPAQLEAARAFVVKSPLVVEAYEDPAGGEPLLDAPK